MSHRDPITLGREQILGKENGNFKVFSLMKRIPLPKLSWIFNSRGGRLMQSNCLLEISREEAARPGSIAPAYRMGVTKRIGSLHPLAEEGPQIGAAAAWPVNNIWIQTLEQQGAKL